MLATSRTPEAFPIRVIRPGDAFTGILVGSNARAYHFVESGTGKQVGLWKTRTLESKLEGVADGTSVRVEAFTPKRFVNQTRLRVTTESDHAD